MNRLVRPKISVSQALLRPHVAHLRRAYRAFSDLYHGDSGRRQPVHTVYGGAHLFRSDTAAKLGAVALRALEEHAPDFVTFARVIGLPGADRLPGTAAEAAALQERLQSHVVSVRRGEEAAWLADAIYRRVVDKLKREPVEDFRLDFEDGYGNRPDLEEDGHALSAAAEVAQAFEEGTLPPGIGIRIKPLSEELRERSLRTLDLFVTALVNRAGRQLPPGFVVTLPKVVIPEQVTFLADVLGILERQLGLDRGALACEVMIETPQTMIDAHGRIALSGLQAAGQGRLVAAHFGTYDYTAASNITAAHQHMSHPACEFARQLMQTAFAGTGVWLSDGSTAILPVGPHRAAADQPLTEEQLQENREAVHRAWKLHYDDIQHSLVSGFYQGWDLHPAQLPTRYAAVYAFFLSGLGPAAERLRNFLARAAQATLLGSVFDDAATGQGLLNFFLRAINCGAISEEEALSLTGLTHEEILTRSFVEILRRRS